LSIDEGRSVYFDWLIVSAPPFNELALNNAENPVELFSLFAFRLRAAGF
jgi:hypothetical protein